MCSGKVPVIRQPPGAEGSEEVSFVYFWEEQRVSTKGPTYQVGLMVGEGYYKLSSGLGNPGVCWVESEKAACLAKTPHTLPDAGAAQENRLGSLRSRLRKRQKAPLPESCRSMERAGELDWKGLAARDEENLAVTCLDQQLRTRQARG